MVEKRAVENRYTDEIDTLIYFRKANSFVQFYKTKNKVMLDSLSVTNENFIKLRTNFDIGMSKQSFLEHFNAHNPRLFSDSIAVVSDEANSFISFLFNNDKLYKIVSYSNFN